MEVSIGKPRRRGRAAGTPDMARIGKALASRGLDTRFWISSGTVGVLGDSGTFSVDDQQAVYPVPGGVLIDVRLEPCEQYVTARYHGVSAGRFGHILVPVFQGDEVLVLVPDGDLRHPAITALLLGSNIGAPISADWGNDPTPRVLFDLNVPLEIRAPGVTITSAGLMLNGRMVTPGEDTI